MSSTFSINARFIDKYHHIQLNYNICHGNQNWDYKFIDFEIWIIAKNVYIIKFGWINFLIVLLSQCMTPGMVWKCLIGM